MAHWLSRRRTEAPLQICRMENFLAAYALIGVKGLFAGAAFDRPEECSVTSLLSDWCSVMVSHGITGNLLIGITLADSANPKLDYWL
jgi:hypothetical protein